MEIENPKQSLHVPEDVIEEILSRLPVKSLLRFKCVSKPWRSLISSKRFAMIQLQKSRYDRSFAHWRVILRYGYGEAGLKQCSMREYINDESIDDPSPLENLINLEHPISGTVVGSINGVLCIMKMLGCFSLYNPSTRILHELPEIDNAVPIYSFGWDETSDAYKVFVVVLDSDSNKVGQLYCSKTNSWKTVGQGSVSSLSGVGTCVGGKIHWLSEDRQHIESFDLKSEVFEVTELPFKPDAKASMCVGETRGCIVVLVFSKKDNSCDTWTMKEYGVKESWAKEAKARRSRRKKVINCYAVEYYIESLVSPLFDKEKEENVE